MATLEAMATRRAQAQDRLESGLRKLAKTHRVRTIIAAEGPAARDPQMAAIVEMENMADVVEQINQVEARRSSTGSTNGKSKSRSRTKAKAAPAKAEEQQTADLATAEATEVAQEAAIAEAEATRLAEQDQPA